VSVDFCTCGIVSLIGSLVFFKGDPEAAVPDPVRFIGDFGDNGELVLLGDNGGVLPTGKRPGKWGTEDPGLPVGLPGTGSTAPDLTSSKRDSTCKKKAS
jgi:hypothetical protein